MSRPRFFSPFDPTARQVLIEDPDEFEHFARVLRLKNGAEVELVNGRGALMTGVVAQVNRSSALILRRDLSDTPCSQGVRLTIACAIPKRAKFELIIEKCTELGVARIIPLLSARTEVIADPRRNEKKAGRFARVVINAAKQARLVHFPVITEQMPFSKALELLACEKVKIFVPWLEGERIPVAKAWAEARGLREAAFFIGPEGDFTPQEVRMAVEAGAVPVSLGASVLKVDTAAIAVAAFARFRGL